jgi:hypothetical protein
MYGMVNQAMHQMVSEVHGEDAWNRIRLGAGCEVERFLRMDSYPDELTYRLVAAAVEELKIPADRLLHAFGEYWVGFAQAAGYADFFRACDSYAGFVRQLDAMHARLELTFPDFKPPQFACNIESPERIEVIYRSHRVGLAPFVHGLLVGLGEPFGVTATVAHLASQAPESGGATERFLVTLAPR